MAFSSLQLNPSLVEYLGLNPMQVRSIQSLMDKERPRKQLLVLELRTVSAEMGVPIGQSQNNENESLAATQARLLKQLMRANSRLQRRIGEVLDPQQRKTLDTFKPT